MRTLLVFTAAILALIDHACTARILGLFPHTGKSHQMVFDPLLRRLAERGHHVTVVTFFPVKNPPANYTDISLEGIAPLGVETMDLSLFENSNKLVQFLGLEKIVTQIWEYQPLADIAIDVCSKLVNFQPLAEALKKEYDIILVENFCSDCMLGLAHVYGQKAPFVHLLSSGMMLWSPSRIGLSDNPSYIPVITSTFTTPMSFSQRLENTLLYIFYKLWYRYTVQLKEKEIIEKTLDREVPDLQDLGKNVSLMLLNAFHSLNGVRPQLPGVVEVGGMHLDHGRKPIPHVSTDLVNTPNKTS